MGEIQAINYQTILNIKNEEYLKQLKKMCIYYNYGKDYGNDLILKGMEKEIEIESILNFVKEYICSNKLLLGYFGSKGLKVKKRIMEFTLSSLLSFQNSEPLDNITSFTNYRMYLDKDASYIMGTMKKSGVNIYDDFSYNPDNYDILLNNSMLDLFKNFNGDEDNIVDEHGIKYSEDNDLDFFSGFAIKDTSPLKEDLKEDFIKSIAKTKCDFDSRIEEKHGYTYGYIKRVR